MTRASNRTELFPVYFVEPYHGNEAALGFDLGSNPARRTALEEARDTGSMAASRRIKLVQEKGDQYGFLVFAPVYRRGGPLDAVEGRRTNLRGFVLGVFRIGDMLEKTLGSRPQEDIPFSVYDTAAPEEERFLYHHSSRPFPISTVSAAGMQPAADTPFHFDKRMNIEGREWLMVFTTDPDYVARNRAWQPWVVLFAGLLLTGSATYLSTNARRMRLLSVINLHLRDEVVERKEAEEALRESEERYRSLFDESPVALLELDGSGPKAYVDALDRAGITDLEAYFDTHPEEVRRCAALLRITDVNRAVMASCGSKSKETLVHELENMFAGDEGFQKTFQHIVVAIGEGKTRYEHESNKTGENGTKVYEYTKWSVPAGYEKTHSRVLISVMDMTERRQAEEALRRSEATLKSVISASPVGIALVTIDRTIIWISDGMSAMTGYTPEETKIRSLRELYPTDEEFARVDAIVYGEIRKGAIGTVDTKWVRNKAQGRLRCLHHGI